MALAIMMLVATPAFAGHKHNKNSLDKKIDNLNQQIGNEVIFGGSVGGTDDRRNRIDKLEQALGYALFQRNNLKDDN
jgi:hypothetical protein